MPKPSFREQLQSHIGGLVRVRLDRGGAWSRVLRDFNGKIGLLVRVDYLGPTRWRVDLLIDGNIEALVIYTGDLELLGAEDA
jgi:hypothetical protein